VNPSWVIAAIAIVITAVIAFRWERDTRRRPPDPPPDDQETSS